MCIWSYFFIIYFFSKMKILFICEGGDRHQHLLRRKQICSSDMLLSVLYYLCFASVNLFSTYQHLVKFCHMATSRSFSRKYKNNQKILASNVELNFFSFTKYQNSTYLVILESSWYLLKKI